MSLEFIFRPEARAEFFDAISWYEDEREDLGKEFAREVFDALERAGTEPEVFRKVRGRAQKIRLKRFTAYTIYFAIKDDTLSVLSVFHGSRNPAELRRRLQ